MFSTKTYVERRKQLKKGLIFFPGNDESPMNYAANTYPFRQDSSFLYYFGLDQYGLNAVIDIDNDTEIIFGDDRTIDDIIWMGPEAPLAEKAELVGVQKTKDSSKIKKIFKKAQKSGQKIHFLPQYRYENIIKIEQLTGINHSKVNKKASPVLIKAVVDQRSIKSDEEASEIESAVEISYEMNTAAMKLIRPGMIEREVYGAIEGISLSGGNGISFPMIFSIHGETLHNHHHNNIMNSGNMAVLDSGAESLLHYASDITRTIPVSGQFTERQKEIYQIVLDAQEKAIDAMTPGVPFKECHLLAAKTIADGLKHAGLMKGNMEDAVKAGAHALFFPHGLGHMLGLDVHDMEGLGEDLVGYGEKIKRSKQFGLAYLRMGKKLQPGHVITVEPGIYFIPQLIDLWKNEKKHTEFINYSKVEEYKEFGGIRIEDDILVTDSGRRILGRPIPKTIEDVENACRK